MFRGHYIGKQAVFLRFKTGSFVYKYILQNYKWFQRHHKQKYRMCNSTVP